MVQVPRRGRTARVRRLSADGPVRQEGPGLRLQDRIRKDPLVGEVCERLRSRAWSDRDGGGPGRSPPARRSERSAGGADGQRCGVSPWEPPGEVSRSARDPRGPAVVQLVWFQGRPDSEPLPLRPVGQQLRRREERFVRLEEVPP